MCDSCSLQSEVWRPGQCPDSRDLQRLVLEDLRVNASYMKCYRAKEKVILGLQGSDEDSYLKLAEYLYMLKLVKLVQLHIWKLI